jgi:hypothetical protein
MKSEKKFIWKTAGIAGFIATLCCLSPIVLVLFGISTASFAIGLGDVLFKQYWWAFVLLGILTLVFSITFYFRKQYGVCTLDEAKKYRKKITNMFFLGLGAFAIMYIIFEIVLQSIWAQLGWSSWDIFWNAIKNIFT